ncbi:MAG: pimeloyl-ACP methyl ester carboxylesterase [Zhongshania sp.]|jgi:pimeloyl-ACP methyl ester carboxylesterase|nr:alpha/beta fold hydrolase [Zhongshania sp.]
MSSTALEKRFHIEGLNIAAKLWGDKSGLPVIALHGWLDNAASFDVLASQLSHLQILAIDLLGHGLSDHKPPSGNYAIWDDLRCIVAVADQMGWQDFSVIGHSRGANIATLLTGALSTRIRHLVCIDGLVPEPESAADFPMQMGRYLKDFTAAKDSRGDRGHVSFDAAVAARCKATSMTPETAALIVERGAFVGDDGRYYWCSDKRLKLASPAKLTLEQLQATIDAITAPAMLISAKQGLGQWMPTLPVDITSRFKVREIDGQHHCHMESQSAQIAEWISDFLMGS